MTLKGHNDNVIFYVSISVNSVTFSGFIKN